MLRLSLSLLFVMGLNGCVVVCSCDIVVSAVSMDMIREVTHERVWVRVRRVVKRYEWMKRVVLSEN